MAVKIVDQVTLVGALETADEFVEDLDTSVSDCTLVLPFRVVEHVLDELLAGDVGFLRVRDELLDCPVEVGLQETAAESAKPADEIVCRDMALVFEVDVVEEDFASVLEVELLEAQRASQLEARGAELLLGEFSEVVQ